MRKLALVVITIVALSVFTAFAVAQTPGGTTGANQNSSQAGSSSTNMNSNNSAAPVTGSSTDPAMVNGDQQRTAASSGSDASAGEKTLDGCVVKEQNDYFIQPASGDRERLVGTADLSSHVGHEVKVHGNEQMATASSDRTSTSGSATAESQNNAAGSIAGNAGSSNANGTSAAAGSNWSGKDFMVTKVDMVSASCPADIQKKVDENKSK